MSESKRGISADVLKYVAYITMFIDHIGAGLIEPSAAFRNYGSVKTYDILIRLIGRVAFPIFCFLLVEGFNHTRNKWKYALNLLLFALITEIPFDYTFKGTLFTLDYQNVDFTLLLGLLTLIFADMIYKSGIKSKLVRYLLQIPVGVVFAVIADLMKVDYGAWGILLIFVIYYTRELPNKWRCIISALPLIWEFTSFIAFILIYRYNGVKKGKINKYVFYSLYPAHLAIYAVIRYFLIVRAGW
ncbi:MAG: conjugal transfer protein TraX [Lachnospiraceae bacterium]|nr:conjugal transfer protein TraX [Lachnospiraceae bacterium]